jgi:hypothetical protein
MTPSGPYKSKWASLACWLIVDDEGVIRVVREHQQPKEGIAFPSLAEAKAYLKENGYEVHRSTDEVAPQ